MLAPDEITENLHSADSTLTFIIRPYAVRWKNFNPLKFVSLSSLSRKTEEARSAETAAEEISPHLALGRRGEEIAAEFLVRKGYRLVASNFTVPVGRNLRGAIVNAEIDLVAYEGETLCFVEVKTRRSDWFAQPEANVDLRKQRQVARAARAYRRLLGVRDE